MARIPEEVIERLKREVPLARLAEARGVALEAHGKDLLGLCPFHDDHEPSLVVTPEKNLWHCLGACQAGGSVIDWVMKAERVSFRHAVELLRADVPGLGTQNVMQYGKQSTVRKLPLPVAPSADDDALLREVILFYHRTLLESPEALEYLEKRGIRSEEAIERFKLGYANRTLAYRLPLKSRKEGAELRSRLERLGILRATSGHEHLAGSLVIPVIDEKGRVTEVYGRKILNKFRAGTPLHLYLPGPHRGVFNVEALANSKEVILCEALIDALTFFCAGFRNVTSSYGVEGFTEDHIAAMKRYGTERVLIAYDRDEAGDRAAEALAPSLAALGIACYRVEFPRGMDANEFALKVTPACQSLELALRKAVPIGNAPPRPREIFALEGAAETTTEPAAKEEASQVADASAAPAEEGPAAPAAAEPTPPPAPAPSDPPPSTAAPEPPPLSSKVPAEVREEEVTIRLGDRRYRIRGLKKNLTYDSMRVNLLCGRGDTFHVDTLDLYSARQRSFFTKQAAEEVHVEESVLKRDLGQVLLALEELQDREIKKALEKKEKTPPLSEAERAAALELLRAPDLLARILRDFERLGVVGEETNKLLGYLAACSRKLEEPLAVIIQSSSAAGKSALMDAILALVPEEDRVKYSAMTGQSLFYMGQSNLSHKILAIVEEEGAEKASYALKLLQSEGELTIASTGKDPATGKLVTHEYKVEGPVMIFLTTTAIEIDEELLNRCIVLTVDEERSQTAAIHRLQRRRETLHGLLEREDRDEILKLHRNAQRLLRPLLVANPFAEALTFVDDRTRTRRDHMKYLTLIRAIAFLHQYQRPVETATRRERAIEYVAATLEDIAVANRLAHEVLGRSLDELPPQTRRLLLLLDEMVTVTCRRDRLERAELRFSRREVREYTGWGQTQLKVHLRRLEDLEYLLVHRGPKGQSFVYELLYDGKGKDGKPFLSGLLDPSKLASCNGCNYEEKWAGVLEEKSAPGRPLVGPMSGDGRDDISPGDPLAAGFFSAFPRNGQKNTSRPPENGTSSSYALTAEAN